MFIVIEAFSGGSRLSAAMHRVEVERSFAPKWKWFRAQAPIYMVFSDEIENKTDHELILSADYLSTEESITNLLLSCDPQNTD
jgi:hypothetical protein